MCRLACEFYMPCHHNAQSTTIIQMCKSKFKVRVCMTNGIPRSPAWQEIQRLRCLACTSVLRVPVLFMCAECRHLLPMDSPLRHLTAYNGDEDVADIWEGDNIGQLM